MVAGGVDSLAAAMDECSEDERSEMHRLDDLGLPPVTSLPAISVMTGYSPGFIRSLLQQKSRHYREFSIPKGRSRRTIEAPRVGLKFVQKWLAWHFAKVWEPHESAHGFVSGRSHISAASVHLGARWVVSVDIKDFFPSTSEEIVRNALVRLDYNSEESLEILCGLCCFRQRLPQGAPTSPVLSNIAIHPIDEEIANLAATYGCRYTRYADDIVLSGKHTMPSDVVQELEQTFLSKPWSLSDRKKEVSRLPNRLKVHGLLVHGERLRLTKGYRNRIRAYRHMSENNKISDHDTNRIMGHLEYSKQVDRFNSRSQSKP